MSPRTWPVDWEDRRAGKDCEFCAESDAAVDRNGNVRVFEGELSTAYLHRLAPQPGLVSVRWRGRHVADPCDMGEHEAAGFWSEVMHVARAVHRVFEPCQLNYDILGNSVPHVHTNLICRYLDDPSPGTPIRPWVLREVPPTDLAAQAERLRRAMSTTT
jgi:diadenosine tetraphosphate (Ap4A) HIT family hydrolase